MWKAACWIGITVIAGIGIYKVAEGVAESAKQVGKSVDEFLRNPEMMDKFFDNLEKIGFNVQEIDQMRRDVDKYNAITCEATTVN